MQPEDNSIILGLHAHLIGMRDVHTADYAFHLARQVLDESHTIASKSNTMTVVEELVANRRWCMTGYGII